MMLTNHSSGVDWLSHSSPLHSRSTPPPPSITTQSSPAPDTTSPVYPDRLIRPLPKKRIRDRLSNQQTEDIVFPSVPQKTAPLFSFPYPETNRRDLENVRPEADENGREQGSRAVRRDLGVVERSGNGKGPTTRQQGMLRQRPHNRINHVNPTIPPTVPVLGSASSSVDGDEGFENTNNKKKRKIPQPQHALTSVSQSLSNVSTDMANLGISNKEADAVTGAEILDTTTASPSSGSAYHASTTTITTSPSSMPSPSSAAAAANLTGSGRGRYTRAGRASLDNLRRPLTTSTNGVNVSASSTPTRSTKGMCNFFFIFFFVFFNYLSSFVFYHPSSYIHSLLSPMVA